jgi:L-aspartate oxidase
MRDELGKPAAGKKDSQAGYANAQVESGVEESVRKIQDLMWQDVGIARNAQGLYSAIERLQEMIPRLGHPHTRRAWEALNLCQAGLLVARCALAREESRGAHYRTDFPAPDDSRFLKHSIAGKDAVWFE